MADFTLVIRLVDEKASQDSFLLKIEDVHTPEHVVAGQPFPIHYRVGNLGGGDLADVGGNAEVYVVGPRVYEYIDPIAASETRWEAGVSYHTGSQTANAASVSIGEATPFEVMFTRPGPSWVFVGVITYDEAGEERGFHGLWHNLMVLSGTTFDPVAVSVDGTEYLVEAAGRRRRAGHDNGEPRRQPGVRRGAVAAGESDLHGRGAHAGVGWDLRAGGGCRATGYGRVRVGRCGESVIESPDGSVCRPV